MKLHLPSFNDIVDVDLLCVTQETNTLTLLCAIDLHCWRSQTMTYSFTAMNMDTVVYFELIPHTCLAGKYSAVHQMCINLCLKIVPNKCTFYSLSNVC